MDKNNIQTLPILLRAIANGQHAIDNKQHVIFNAAALLIEQMANRIKYLEESNAIS